MGSTGGGAGMGSVDHLLCADEAALLACMRDLQRFGDDFEQTYLDAAERRLAGLCESSARAIVSQGLFLARILAEDGIAQTPSGPREAPQSCRRADGADLRLLALIEAAQSSRNRLEALLRQEARPTPELVFVLIRFAALLVRRPALAAPRQRSLSDRTAVCRTDVGASPASCLKWCFSHGSARNNSTAPGLCSAEGEPG